MKKIYLYIFLSASLISCEKDEIISQKEISQPLQELPYVENIEYQNLPEDFFNFFQEKKFNKNQEYQNFFFGKVRKDMPAVKIVNKAGKISYTFVLENQEDLILSSSSTVYFDNLVVYKDDNRADLVHIIRYIPTSEWYKNSKDFKEYSGSVIIYLPTGKKLSELQVVNGNRDQANQKNFNKVSCNLKLESQTELCTQLHEDDGTPIGELKCTTTYHYTWECSTGGSEGGSETGTSGPDHEEVPLGGGSTAPTLPAPEEDKINTDQLNNPCVEAIIDKLMTKDRTLSGDLTHISQHVLTLFANSSSNSLYFESSELGLNSAGHQINAQADPYLDGWKIVLDTDLLSDATQLSIAKTVIHESVHAWIGYNLKENRTSDLVANLNLIYQKFKDQDQYFNLTQHEFMGQYVSVFAHSLAAFDNHRFSIDYYQSLSWGGLETSSAYSQLTNQSEIQKIIQDERFNKSDAKSTPCL